jgi:hypothetical protein
VPHRRYLRNYSPITYETDDLPDIFAAASRGGMRSPTFAASEGEVFVPEATSTFRRESRNIHAVMAEKDTETPKKKLPAKPKHVEHSVSPWFALSSGMVVAGAFVMALVAVTPESVIPKGAIAKVVERALTATVIFSR